VKKSKYFPKKLKKEGLVEIGDIRFGIVEERGEDLDASQPFKKCNLADFIDETGYFDLVKFVGFNQQSFPFIYKLSCCLAALRTNEVGCERFLSIAGYVSNPRRTSLKVKHYESLAMLKMNMRHIYIDEDWVVQQYLSMEKNKEWDDLETMNDEKVAELELLWYATDRGIPIHELQQFEEQEEDNNNIEADDVADDVEIELATSSVAKKPVDVHSDTSNNGSTKSAMSHDK
jgi:hypothetical protein